MDFSREAVEKIASLARLKLTDAEVGEMGRQLSSILEYIAQLEEVDTTGVEPLAHCLPIQNVFREDRVQPSLPTDDALANAPKRHGDFYAVPAVLD